MLLQRLITHPEFGFNYDYMGSAEYMFGSATRGREALAREHLAGNIGAKRVRFVEYSPRSEAMGETDAVMLARKADLVEVGPVFHVRVIKEFFRVDKPNIIGWMHVDHTRRTSFSPLLIVRNMPEHMWRIDAFLKDPIAFLEGEKQAQNLVGYTE